MMDASVGGGIDRKTHRGGDASRNGLVGCLGRPQVCTFARWRRFKRSLFGILDRRRGALHRRSPCVFVERNIAGHAACVAYTAGGRVHGSPLMYTRRQRRRLSARGNGTSAMGCTPRAVRDGARRSGRRSSLDHCMNCRSGVPGACASDLPRWRSRSEWAAMEASQMAGQARKMIDGHERGRVQRSIEAIRSRRLHEAIHPVIRGSRPRRTSRRMER
jgi:hypothetical protein